ncbi:hypothetical protein U0070_024939 [Myodes glareolus]|uniref:Uncharacterized protein n=1 Tax=Myodes glareolus TaxID=447135 RepID=A0AAW0ISH9_MYOGA
MLEAVTAAIGGAVAVAAAPVVLTAMGFTGMGIAAASIAAKMMSAAAIANGGGVAAGSLVATLQSVGLTLLAQTALGSGTSVFGSALGALKAGSILSGGPAYVLAVCPTGAKAAIAVLGGAMTVAAVPPVLGAVGFTGTGIAASSLAAKMMSLSAIANGGGVAAGSLVATLQSVGAAGLSMSSKVLLGSAGSALVASVMGISQSSSSSLLREEDMKGEGTEADKEAEETPPSISNPESDPLTSGKDLSSWDVQDLLFWIV